MKVFEFAASTSDVEWGLSRYKNGQTAIGTLHMNGQAPNFKSLDESFTNNNMTLRIHSHSGGSPITDFQPSVQDASNAVSYRKANPNMKIQLFMPQNPQRKLMNY